MDNEADESFNTILDWLETGKNFLIKGQKIQGETSIHLRLSIEKLLKYVDKYHYKIPDREFLEHIIKENNELLAHYDEFAKHVNSFDDKVAKSFDKLMEDQEKA